MAEDTWKHDSNKSEEAEWDDGEQAGRGIVPEDLGWPGLVWSMFGKYASLHPVPVIMLLVGVLAVYAGARSMSSWLQFVCYFVSIVVLAVATIWLHVSHRPARPEAVSDERDRYRRFPVEGPFRPDLWLFALKLQGGKRITRGSIPCRGDNDKVTHLERTPHLGHFIYVLAGAAPWPHGGKPSQAVADLLLRTVESDELRVVEEVVASFHLVDARLSYVICEIPDNIPLHRSRSILDRITRRLREGGIREQAAIADA